MENNQRWQPADRSLLESEKIARPSLTYWQDCWQRLRKNKSAILSLVLRPLCMVNAVVVSLAANGAFDAAASITK